MVSFVYNIDRTSRRKCRCIHRHARTWLNHWRRHSGVAMPLKCQASHCRRPVQVGAHVREEGGDGRIVWIIPFCKYHNKRRSSTPIGLKHGAMLVGGSMTADCG